MPTIPKAKTLSGNSAEILNVIRENSTIDYKNAVPIASANAESIRGIGNILMNNPALQNNFLSALVNRIARVLITSKSFQNPWAFFKKGMLDLGEVVEEVYVNLAKPHQYDPEYSETNFMKREIPDVRSQFHVLNYQKYYKVSIEEQELSLAFLSYEGVTDLVAKIVEQLYAAMNYDELQVMMYMLAKVILDGRVHAEQIPTVETANLSNIVSAVKKVSDIISFKPSTNYNPAGVYNQTAKNDQYLIMSADFSSKVDVQVLANAFNMSKAEFMGHQVGITSFGDLDTARLQLLFDGDPNYEEIGEDELTLLDAIPCVLVDRNFFMIFDRLLTMRDTQNDEGLYYQNWLHSWKIISWSMFSNGILFVPGAPAVTSVTCSPKAVSASAGQTVQVNAVVQTTNFAPQTVTWSITAGTGATVDQYGLVTLDSTATGSITVTATSTYDSTKKDTCTITVGA